MNVALDTQFSAIGPANTENTTITYQPSAYMPSMENISRSGYKLDIADKVMDNEAYKGHGLTAEEIMQQASNRDVSVQKDFMIVMSSCVSGEDLAKMQEEGFTPGSTDVETYVTIVDKIKVTLAQAGVEVAGYNDDLDLETVEEITGSRVNANELIDELSQALQKNDIPVTNENIAELVKAVMEASDIGKLSEDAIKYLIVNQKAPTIENIYKAQYSSTGEIRQAQGYYSEGMGSYRKYYAKKADSINWDNLQSQLETIVKQAGLEAQTQAVENAKWLVESGIELNVNNLTMVTELKNLSLPMSQSDIAQLCVTAMQNGKSPIKADMTGEQSIAQQAQEMMQQANEITNEAVHEVAESGKDMNLKNLYDAQKQINGNAGEKASDETSLKEIQARRQLEEIRLIMSEEANRHLLKSGISINTTELSELVEALKAAEENLKSVLFQGGTAAENTQRAIIYEETLTKTKEIANMPAAVLGRLMSSVHESTLLGIHEEGSALQNQMGKASAAYETLMTEPRKDLGDRISKAFQNVDDILKDMDIETSEANRRAVRILGYNRMDITDDNINAVKEADSQVTGVISKMTPAATLRMIREQKNPLQMTMDELETYLNNMDSEPAADAERFSQFLQRLDRSNGITEDEREAYIGIYRMFRQIEKSDGAVIGSIVATGAEMNFKNMLAAVRTASDKNIDLRIDDEFGALENLITKGKAIDAQINTGYKNQTGSETNKNNTKGQEKYYARLSGAINEELSERTDFNKLDRAGILAETTIEQFADNIKMTQMSENSELAAQEKAENLKDFRNNIQQAEQIDEQIIESLINYGQAVSVDNIQAAFMLIFNRGSLFKQVIAKSDKTNDNTEGDESVSSDTQNDVLAQADSFVEGLSNAEQAKMSYQEIINKANKAVENMVYSKDTSYIDVKAAKALYKGLSLASNLAREENYEVPMNIKGEITSVNLKIYHNVSQKGKVAVTLDTQNFGKVAAEFDVTANRISGMVVYENKAQANDLEQLSQQISDELTVDGDKQINISLVHAKEVDLNRFGQDRTTEQAATQTSTAELYHTAKAFLTALKEIE